ncbi:hypothetical protein PEDI_05700 [Persicobacter diffluens]|uniref:Uncharacterized protein n=1 Tax=Persicobacter diffluens TaxID=981 RepID=A0AAN4VW46_9BACT|nr:hypothetical protein PEDI_05700 [Persicobacter diffluens]
MKDLGIIKIESYKGSFDLSFDAEVKIECRCFRFFHFKWDICSTENSRI